MLNSIACGRSRVPAEQTSPFYFTLYMNSQFPEEEGDSEQENPSPASVISRTVVTPQGYVQTKHNQPAPRLFENEDKVWSSVAATQHRTGDSTGKNEYIVGWTCSRNEGGLTPVKLYHRARGTGCSNCTGAGETTTCTISLERKADIDARDRGIATLDDRTFPCHALPSDRFGATDPVFSCRD